jgi:hypothetical protein
MGDPGIQLGAYENNLEKKVASPVEKTRQEINVPGRIQGITLGRFQNCFGEKTGAIINLSYGVRDHLHIPRLIEKVSPRSSRVIS